MAACGVAALAASVYLVVVLEILKLRRFRLRQLVGLRGPAAPQPPLKKRVPKSRTSSTVIIDYASPACSIPPLDGEGVALEERDGWGEYPGVENNPPPDRLPPVDLPTRGRYESEPVVKLSTPRLECRGPASAFTHHQLGPRLTQGATYCVKHTQAPSSLNRNVLTKPAGTCPNGQAP